MKSVKRIIGGILACVLLLNVASAFAQQNSGHTYLDFDAAGGYSGDYCLIYNPEDSIGGKRLNTGNLRGLIRRDVSDVTERASVGGNDDKMYFPHIGDSENTYEPTEVQDKGGNYSVGDKRTFVIQDLVSGNLVNMEMVLCAKGEHCYVWEPTDESDYPLTSIVANGGDRIAQEFDSKYDLMISSFGEFRDPQGEGRINMFYYDINDNWYPGSTDSYVGGFFNRNDMNNSNKCAAIHVDTYPSILYEDVNGTQTVNFNSWCYNVVIHEFQHMINYSHVSANPDIESSVLWLDEAMSAAAEELVYPGSSVSGRIPSWINEKYQWVKNSMNEWTMISPVEFKASASEHRGTSFYSMALSGEAYAQVSLFSQYIYSQTRDNTIFKRIIEKYTESADAALAIPAALRGTKLEGMSMSELVMSFRIALIANDPVSYDGLYGFVPQSGYTPTSENYFLENPYSLLSVPVFTDNSRYISGGGFIVVKPVDGTFYPPEDADEGLVYVGIRVYGMQRLDMGDVTLDGTVNTGDAVMLLKTIAGIHELAYIQKKYADMNGDGKINTGDVVSVLKIAAGL